MPKEQEKTFDDPELNRAFMLGMATGLELCANGLRRMTEQQEEQRWKRHSAPIAAREWNPRHGKACSGGFPTRDGSSLTDDGTAPDAGIFSGDLFHPDGRKVSDRERATAIVRLCQESDSRCGIWKRIDENRELMELLATEAQFMKKFPYAAVWIAKTDAFLGALAEIVRPVNLFEGSGRQFPRPWPYEDARQVRDQLQHDFVTRAFGW